MNLTHTHLLDDGSESDHASRHSGDHSGHEDDVDDVEHAVDLNELNAKILRAELMGDDVSHVMMCIMR